MPLKSIHDRRSALWDAVVTISPFSIMILTFSLILSLGLSYLAGISSSDLRLFYMRWGRDLVDYGFGDFYANSYCDYPPLFVYLLGFSGFIDKLLHVSSPEWLGFIYKLPQVAFIYVDWILARFLFRISNPDLFVPRKLYLLDALFLLNPAFIHITTQMGQSDSILLAFFLLAAIGVVKNNLLLVLTASALGFLTKPQMVFILPFLIPWIFSQFKIRKVVSCTIYATLIAAVAALPFLYRLNASWIIEFYSGRASTYKYTSLGAGNLMGLIGGNHGHDLEKAVGNLRFLDISLVFIAMFMLFMIVAIYVCSKSLTAESSLAFLALSVFGMYFVSTRMHSRYSYYGIGLLFCLICIFPRNKLTDKLFVWGLSIVFVWQCFAHFPTMIISAQHLSFDQVNGYLNSFLPYKYSFYFFCIVNGIVFIYLMMRVLSNIPFLSSLFRVNSEKAVPPA